MMAGPTIKELIEQRRRASEGQGAKPRAGPLAEGRQGVDPPDTAATIARPAVQKAVAASMGKSTLELDARGEGAPDESDFGELDLDEMEDVHDEQSAGASAAGAQAGHAPSATPRASVPLPAPRARGVTPEDVKKIVKAQVNAAIAPIMAELEALKGTVKYLDDTAQEFTAELVGREAEEGKEAKKGLLDRANWLEESVNGIADVLIGKKAEGETPAQPGLVAVVFGTEAEGETPAQPGLLDKVTVAEGEVSGLRVQLFGKDEKATLEPFGDAPVIPQLTAGVKEALESKRPEANPLHADTKRRALAGLLVKPKLTKEDVKIAAKECGVQETREILETFSKSREVVVASLIEFYGISEEPLTEPEKGEFEQRVELAVARANKLVNENIINWNEVGGDA
ncbi:MAG: hypothetical protein PHF60_00230 [Candidatus ainarchaeum sp.]|nr:hypothetical protein [Candidatus ainarchaeum sp.]